MITKFNLNKTHNNISTRKRRQTLFPAYMGPRQVVSLQQMIELATEITQQAIVLRYFAALVFHMRVNGGLVLVGLVAQRTHVLSFGVDFNFFVAT